MARISSSRYWFIQIGSVGEATPPEPMILMWCAPWRSSSRTARTHASTPSAMTANELNVPHAARAVIVRRLVDGAHVAVTAGHGQDLARHSRNRGARMSPSAIARASE